MLSNLARISYHHRRRVVLVWFALLVFAVVGAPALAGDWIDEGSLPGTDSQEAYDLLRESFPQRSSEEGSIVFSDVTRDPGEIEALLAEADAIDGVDVGALQTAPDGRVGLAELTFSSEADSDAIGAELMLLGDDLRADGVQVEYGGWMFYEGDMPASEMFGVLAAIVVLLVAFGSVLAMGLPITTALVGIAVGMGGIGILIRFVDAPEVAAQVATMVGIGVGIDYALFIVTRYREALARRGDPEAAVVEAMATAGRAVLFAGGTVMVSLLGMLLIGLSFISGIGIATSFAVAIAVAAALTLLPALLGFLGHRVEWLRVGRRPDAERRTLWTRWAEFVQTRPAVIAGIGLAVLIVMALPAAAMRLAFPDAGNDPTDWTTRQAYDLISEGFGPGANGPIVAAVDLTGATGEAGAEALGEHTGALSTTEGVVAVGEPVLSEDGTAALVSVIPATGPQDEATVDLLGELRDDVVPRLEATTGAEIHLGGATASDIDFANVMSDRLPVFIGGVLAMSFLLLMLVFRSVLVPLKAVIMNMLSIGAAYGLMIAIFQWGWGAGLFGTAAAPVEPWVPMMLFAIVFGLSMDYEVFLLSAVREHFDRTGDSQAAVTRGLASTGRVITAAALIMTFVFGSFVVAEDHGVKLIGFGLAAAVFIDATIVRVLLVPATMELLGDANWWLPRWLDRVLPHVAVEEHVLDTPADEQAGPSAGRPSEPVRV
ncbi:MAG: MMPL family transporter [Actinomycetota bacterium]|nr:MMPL family transporter [Actinomycetota bacterium]